MKLFSTAFCFTLGLVQSSTAKHPNVVLFLVDDMGWRDVACFGSSFYETPNIDRFAKQGGSLYERLRGLPRLFAHASKHHDRQVPGETGSY